MGIFIASSAIRFPKRKLNFSSSETGSRCATRTLTVTKISTITLTVTRTTLLVVILTRIVIATTIVTNTMSLAVDKSTAIVIETTFSVLSSY